MKSIIKYKSPVRMMQADYTPSNIPAFRGNPLVEALPPVISDEDIVDRLYSMPSVTPHELQKLSTEERALRVDELMDAHIPSPTTFYLYPRIRRALIAGYQYRNPLAAETQQTLYHPDAPLPKSRPWNRTSVPSLLYMAPSGKGKSTVVRNILQLFPDVIEHRGYGDTAFYLKQPLFLAVDCPSNGSRQTMLKRIIKQLDDRVGTTYREDLRRKRLNTPDLQVEVGELCAQHFVGMIIIDELHKLRVPSDKSASTNAELATLSFIDELFNQIGAPILLIGTWRCTKLLSKSLECVRRAGTRGRLSEEPFAKDDDHWVRLIEKLWSYQLLKKASPLTDELRDYIHYASGGLPALAVQLLVATQHLALEEESDSINKEMLEHVYNTEFQPLHNALFQLRNKNYVGYEDLLPPKEELANLEKYSVALRG